MTKMMTKVMLLVVLVTGLAVGAMAQVRGGRYRVLPRDTDRFTAVFQGGQTAIVVVKGDGDTDLDLYIFDEYGNKITEDSDYTDECVVRFTPRWTGQFTIAVVNRGNVYNEYTLAMR
jgi:hypothetical protein